MTNNNLKMFSFSIGIFGVLLTTIYSSRLIIHVFHRKNLSDEKVYAHLHESPPIMTLPLVILAFFSMFFGMVSHHYFGPINDGQVERRMGIHNESVTAALHLRLTKLVSLITGEDLKPSYAYLGLSLIHI